MRRFICMHFNEKIETDLRGNCIVNRFNLSLIQQVQKVFVKLWQSLLLFIWIFTLIWFASQIEKYNQLMLTRENNFKNRIRYLLRSCQETLPTCLPKIVKMNIFLLKIGNLSDLYCLIALLLEYESRCAKFIKILINSYIRVFQIPYKYSLVRKWRIILLESGNWCWKERWFYSLIETRDRLYFELYVFGVS